MNDESDLPASIRNLSITPPPLFPAHPYFTVNQYLLLIHGNTKSDTTDEEWESFFVAARTSGMFQGGSEVGAKEIIGDQTPMQTSTHVEGYMRFDSDDKPALLALLQQHPIVLHGGTIELCALPKS